MLLTCAETDPRKRDFTKRMKCMPDFHPGFTRPPFARLPEGLRRKMLTEIERANGHTKPGFQPLRFPKPR